MDPEVCPKCEKVVYDAEGFPAGGSRFHKRCFKCITCSKKLDSNNVKVSGNKLYCKVCLDKVAPAESPKIYSDTSVITATDEKGCPRCGGAVYEAEKVTVKDDFYHKKCLTCTKCSRALDTLGLSVAPDGNAYCKVCHKTVTAYERPQTDTSQIQAEDEKEGCPRCGGKVFEAEKMTTKSGLYHKKCFTCGNCKRALDYQLCTEGPDSNVYCKLCYSHMYGHKAKPNLNTADVTAIQGQEGEATTCPRCQGMVFDAEKQVAKSGSYHKKCFTCVKCKHQLGPGDFTNGPDNDIYCVYCYRTTHGHKATTKSMPLDTTSILAESGDKTRCPRCSGRVFAAEKMVASSGWYHRHCFRCTLCSQPVDSTSVCDGPDNKIYCRVCYGRIRGSSKPKFLDNAALETWTIQAGEEENPCPRCSGKVFEAERMISTRHQYHKKCFTCKECTRPMDQFIACDSPDGEVVCRPCYQKKYSCTSYALSGADTLKLLDTTTIKSDEGGQNACPKCDGKVFHAEKVEVNNRVFHKKCATCFTCSKPLTSRDLCDGKDGNIFCQSCYGRKYGAPGYRGAGCGDWTDAESAQTLRPCTNMDVSKIKGEEGDINTCKRCVGKIFETERIASNSFSWHRTCFCCVKCSSPLSATNKYNYEGPDDELYCKTCFKKSFPNTVAPKMFGDTSIIKPNEPENGCPRCEGAVFQAEEVNIKGRLYHKKCLSCKNCKRPIDISLLAVGPDDDIYCQICCNKMSWPGNYAGASDTTLITGDEGEPTNCPRCSGKVFEAEKMNTKKGLYHKKCFSCISCRSQLHYYGAIEGPDDEVYCRVCYLRAYGPGGKNKFGDATPYPVENEESNDACVRCHSKVFEMDKITTKTGMMHKHCLSCNECKTNLDVSSFHNGFDGEVYCKHDYAVKFGHKQKSQYKGWMDVKAIMGEKGDKSACPRCTGMVFEAERMVTRVGNFHRNCFSCIECNKKLDSTTVCEGPDAEVYCQSCYSFEFGTKSRTKPKGKLIKRNNRSRSSSIPSMYKTDDDMWARSTIETWVIKAEKGEQNCCPKCDGKVFEAEKMVTASGSWYHKNCFRCVDCTRMLDSLSNNDGLDGLYCKGCYNVKFGPQVRSTDVEHKIIDTSSIKSEDPKKNCPRCSGAVFSAESIPCKDRKYHKKCASCASCEKPLTYNTVFNGVQKDLSVGALIPGEDQDIYCEGCYHRKFAPSGYRGAGCSSWVDNDSNNHLRHTYQAF